MRKNFIKIGIGILLICLVVLLIKHNVMDEIGRQKVYGATPATKIKEIMMCENGIQEIQTHWFLTRRHNMIDAKQVTESRENTVNADDIAAFLEVDWTDNDILMCGHAIQPRDSARGWGFTIADIDFDGMREMLIAFTSNHCGNNSLYIYKQKEGNVFSYIDTIATPERYMSCGIDYGRISPYMNILDCSTFGGDIHGGIYTVILYKTIPEEGGMPKEIARIEFVGPEERKELYFLGERVYEEGKMRDMLASYMEGYTQIEIDYKTAEKSFARGIFGLSDEECKKENRELRESILKLK